jgi:hypothetical protein
MIWVYENAFRAFRIKTAPKQKLPLARFPASLYTVTLINGIAARYG